MPRPLRLLRLVQAALPLPPTREAESPILLDDGAKAGRDARTV